MEEEEDPGERSRGAGSSKPRISARTTSGDTGGARRYRRRREEQEPLGGEQVAREQRSEARKSSGKGAEQELSIRLHARPEAARRSGETGEGCPGGAERRQP